MNNIDKHWDNIYTNSAENQLGWYETDLSPTLKLIEKAKLEANSRVIIIGAGNTRLVDKLLSLGYTNLVATDISKVALSHLKSRINNNVEFIVDDLTKPTLLPSINSVNLWIDRAVLHFLVSEKDQNTYFGLLKKLIQINGYALFAQFSLDGATKCSGLPVYRYSLEMLEAKLGSEFRHIESFDFTYTMPSGDTRPYIYTLFKRLE